MAEEHHGLSHGHHTSEHKDKDTKHATYWALGLSAVGVLLALLMLSGGGKKKQPGTNTVVQESRPFIPNPSDVSIGSMAAPLYWPALPTSGTPHHPKTHHKGDTDDKKPSKGHSHTKPNDHKGYGKSPNGASHGHTVTVHTHNPKTVPQHTKGSSNG